MKINEEVSIVIPSFNNKKGLNYLIDYFKDKDHQIIVIDNNTRINKITSSHLKNFKNLVYLPQEKNLGFAKAVNLGAKYVKTDWLLILNDDIVFKNPKTKTKRQNDNEKSEIKKSTIIADLLKFAKDNMVDAVSPILINLDEKIENIGYKVLAYGKVELIKKISDNNSQSTKKDWQGLTAACLLIKTKVFKSLGGFDESFFAYLEDVEFFIRFKKAGYQMKVSPLEVIHCHMTTSKTMGSFKTWQDLINWWRLFFKHPDVFKFDLRFLIERGRNISGYLKTILKIQK